MKHQLPNDCYTICKTTEQCRELFEWAKANGIKTSFDELEREDYKEYYLLLLSYCDYYGLVADGSNCVESLQADNTFMPLAEFIARLKGEYVEGKTITLTQKQFKLLKKVLNYASAYNNLTHKEAGELELISEQLNNQ